MAQIQSGITALSTLLVGDVAEGIFVFLFGD